MFLLPRKLKKIEKNEENYITSFDTSKSRVILQRKNNTLKIEFQKFNLRLNIFAVYRT